MNTINYYLNTKTPTVYSGTTAGQWFSLIKNSSFSELIESARAGDLDYEEVKLTQIPCVTYNFFYNSYKKDTNIISSTGLMYIDIDDPSFNIDEVDKSNVYAIYKSFGGYGWGLIIRVDGLTKENFKFNYTNIVNELGLSSYIDNDAVKASQFNVLSFDPNIQINESAKVFVAEKCTPSVGNTSYPIKGEAYTHGGGTLFRKPLRFDNLDEIEFEGDYTVNWDGYDWVRCWIPIRKQTEGSHRLLLSYCNNLVWLNQHISKERCLKVLIGVHQTAFNKPYVEKKLLGIIDSIFKYKLDGTLKPIMFNKKRKIVFKKNSQLTAEDKREIVLAVCNDKKKDESKQKLYEILENWDWQLGKISIRKVAKHYPISKKTVAKYWNEFRDYINELNK
jgi:hypothetical protein